MTDPIGAMTVGELQKLLAAEVKKNPEAKEAFIEISFVGPTRTSIYRPRKPDAKRYVGVRYTPDNKAVVTLGITRADLVGRDDDG